MQVGSEAVKERRGLPVSHYNASLYDLQSHSWNQAQTLVALYIYVSPPRALKYFGALMFMFPCTLLCISIFLC